MRQSRCGLDAERRQRERALAAEIDMADDQPALLDIAEEAARPATM